MENTITEKSKNTSTGNKSDNIVETVKKTVERKTAPAHGVFSRTTIATLMCIPVIICLALCVINLMSVKGSKDTIPFAVTHKYTEEHMLKYTGFGVDLYVYDSGVKDDGTHLSFKSDYSVNPTNLIVSCAVGEGIMMLILLEIAIAKGIKETRASRKHESTDDTAKEETNR